MSKSYSWKKTVAAYKANAARKDWQRSVAAYRAAATKAANKAKQAA